jgi:hypothetical protein
MCSKRDFTKARAAKHFAFPSVALVPPEPGPTLVLLKIEFTNIEIWGYMNMDPWRRFRGDLQGGKVFRD